MEFDLIDLIRQRTALPRDNVVLGIGDDAAVLEVPEGRQLVACTDTLVAGVHFLPATMPEDIGWKALAVNLSDLAAMGAEPAWVLLALTLPEPDMQFVERFAEGFAELARDCKVALVGGDTTQGPLSVTVTALGSVPAGVALTRGGARADDAVFVTGTLGDAAGALQRLRDRKDVPAALLARLQRPQPRIAAGLTLRRLASACIDVSDGLLADLGHVCAASGVGAELDADALPLSSLLSATFDAGVCRELALSGGDDYELCFTVADARVTEVKDGVARTGCEVTRIGRIVTGSGVRAIDARGRDVTPTLAGWEHFSE
jgi:thiamine-monophosphate kinase